MRITKKMLVKKNELLKAVIFVLLGIIFVLCIISFMQIIDIKNMVTIETTKIDYIFNNTEKIIDILTIGE
jgi:uncharacterized protein (UPF0333 family)